MSTMGVGITPRKERPLYLEGTLGYARYDPTFIASNGRVETPVATQWDAYSASGGVGWDFPLARELVLRPIFNFSYGRVDGNGSASGQTGPDRPRAAVHQHLPAELRRQLGDGEG